MKAISISGPMGGSGDHVKVVIISLGDNISQNTASAHGNGERHTGKCGVNITGNGMRRTRNASVHISGDGERQIGKLCASSSGNIGWCTARRGVNITGAGIRRMQKPSARPCGNGTRHIQSSPGSRAPCAEHAKRMRPLLRGLAALMCSKETEAAATSAGRRLTPRTGILTTWYPCREVGTIVIATLPSRIRSVISRKGPTGLRLN